MNTMRWAPQKTVTAIAYSVQISCLEPVWYSDVASQRMDWF